MTSEVALLGGLVIAIFTRVDHHLQFRCPKQVDQDLRRGSPTLASRQPRCLSGEGGRGWCHTSPQEAPFTPAHPLHPNLTSQRLASAPRTSRPALRDEGLCLTLPRHNERMTPCGHFKNKKKWTRLVSSRGPPSYRVSRPDLSTAFGMNEYCDTQKKV